MTTKDKLMKTLVNQEIDQATLERALLVLSGQKLELAENPAGFLSVKEAVKFAGNISRSTLWRWVNGGLKSYQVGGRRVFLPEDLRTFVISQSLPPINPAQGVLNYE